MESKPKGGLTKAEGALSCISYAIGFAIAIYSSWMVSELLLLALLTVLGLPMYLHYKKVCVACENNCPFNPHKSFWNE